jgi:hypothetical protein
MPIFTTYNITETNLTCLGQVQTLTCTISPPHVTDVVFCSNCEPALPSSSDLFKVISPAEDAMQAEGSAGVETEASLPLTMGEVGEVTV